MTPDRAFTQDHGFLASVSTNQQENVGESRNGSFQSGFDASRAGGAHAAFLAAGQTPSFGPASAGDPHATTPAADSSGNNPWQGTRAGAPGQAGNQ